MFVGPLLPSGCARFLQRVVAGLSIAGSIGWTCTGRTYTHAATYAVFVAALRYCNTIWVYYALASWESQTPVNRSEIRICTSVLGAYWLRSLGVEPSISRLWTSHDNPLSLARNM